MARIADLPLAGPITGDEALPVVQDDTTKRMPLGAFLADTIEQVTAEAVAAKNDAQEAATEANLAIEGVNAAGAAQTAAVNAAGTAGVAAVNTAGATQTANATAQANRAEAAAVANESARWRLAPFSAQFPNLNRQFAGLAGHIAYPNTNMLTGGNLLASNAAGAFFIMLQVPHERTNVNRAFPVFGNVDGSSGGNVSLFHYGDDFSTTSRHDRFRWQQRFVGASADVVDISVDVQTRADRWQLIVVRTNGAGVISIHSYAPGEAQINGATQTATGNLAINSFTGTHVLVGDVGTAGGTLTPQAESGGAWCGAIAFHGFVRGTGGTDAQWQAIAEGASITATLAGATSYSLLRDYRTGTTANLADRLTAFATGDTTLAGTIHGTVQPGGTAGRQSATEWLTVSRLPDGYVLSPADSAVTGTVRLTGASAGVSGDLICRVVSPRGDVLVQPFRVGSVTASMAFNLSLPRYVGWGFLEFWPSSHPNRVFRMNSRVGCGDKTAVCGQSQSFIFLNSQGAPQAPTGNHSMCVWRGTRSDPGDTTSNPVARVSTAARPQLFVVEPQMTGVNTGASAMAARIFEHNGGGAVCIVERAVNGTGALDWINNSLSGRLWTQDVEIGGLAGRDLTPLWQWYTNDATGYPNVLNAVIRGAGPNRSDQFFGDATLQLGGYRLGIGLPTRATLNVAGPLDADNFGTARTGAQTGQIAFATSFPTLAVLGPANTDLYIDNATVGTGGTAIAAGVANANLSGPHQGEMLYEGSARLGYRMGETYLRARGMSPTPRNSFLDGAAATINGGRTVITVPARLLNSSPRLQTDNNMFVVNTIPTAGETVTVDGHVITFVASGATGQQVNIGADAAATALALRNYIATALAPTHTVHVWNRHVAVQRIERGRRPVLADTSAGIILPGATIEGFEISENGGSTWSRSGFTAAIVDNETVTLTKASGAWPANVRLRAYSGGPFSYGTADELNARWKGHLYDGCEADNGLGWPLLGFESVTIA